MNALLLAIVVSAAAPPTPQNLPFMRSKTQAKAELVETLKRNIQKVDHAMKVTQDLIGHSRATPYLPDLQFRLAELYVEKSRYKYFLAAEDQASANQGSIVVPEVKLMKEKALSIYNAILREYPDFHDADKVRFYIAHEQRELGNFDDAMKTLQTLVDRHPKSPLATEALLIMGDYAFDKSDLAKAEGYYKQIFARPQSPATDLANFKMGWVRVNQSNHAEAVKYFEAAAIGPDLPGAEAEKRLNVKRESLADLVYSYTEVKPAKGASQYFQSLSDSSQTYTYVLDKLANRYYIKQEWENAIPIFRRLLLSSRDPDRDDERADKLYESLRAMHNKVVPTAGDVKALVRVAERLYSDPRSTPEQRKRAGEDFEVYCRDLATQIQVAAQQKDDKKLQSEAADAYAAYLSLFKVEKWRPTMEKNYAVSLLAAGRYVEAGEAYEKLALKAEGHPAEGDKPAEGPKPEREDLLYTAVGAFGQALHQTAPLSHFEQNEARVGIQQDGAKYVSAFAKNPRAVDVEFNVARAYYDQGEFKKAAEVFAAFAAAHPDDKNAGVAVSLALDSYHQIIGDDGNPDYDDMEKQGQTFLAQATLSESVKSQIRGTLDKAKKEKLGNIAIGSDDAIKSWIEQADQHKGTPDGEEALHQAFMAYREKRDPANTKLIGERLLAEYPQTKSAAEILTALGESALKSADAEQAAARYEDYYKRFPKDGTAVEALKVAAETREQLGDFPKALEDLGKLAADPTYKHHAEIVQHIAEVKYKSGDTAGAAAAAEDTLRSDPGNAKAAAIVGHVLLDAGKTSEVENRLTALTKPILKNASRGSGAEADAAAEVFFILGEALYKDFSAIPASDLERKAGSVGGLEQAYTAAARMGTGTFAVGGLYRLGMAYQTLAQDIMKTPVPAGADPAQVKQLLEQQAQQLQGKADEMFGACVRKARDLEVYNDFATGCANKSVVAEKSGSGEAPVASGTADPGKVAALREAIAKNPNDTQALDDLGATYLAAGDGRRARLTFARDSEVDGTRAVPLVGIGMALIKLGQATDAHDAFAKAIDLDPNSDLAHADMAALRCRFGDVEGAKAELGKIHATPDATPLLDADWQRCK
ncbi:MAG: tetratricopeptide repeat protein [Deltaproteobacteria bacterium]|nr:tetratricopeptide repeat protein [Deltaproteobacteria bacterium]